MKLKQPKTERKILSILLQSKMAGLKVLPSLTKELFSDKNNKKLFRAISSHWKKYTTTPKRSAVIEELQQIGIKDKDMDRYDILLDKTLSTSYSKSDATYYVDTLVKAYRARKVLRSMYEMVDMVERGKVDNAIQHVQLQLAKIQSTGTRDDLEGDYLDDYKARRNLIEDKIKNPEKYRGMPTGIKVFDEYYGGVLSSELAIVTAGTGKGKSIMLMNIAVAAWLKGFDIVYVTIEMSKLECQFRVDSRLSSVIHRKYRKGSLDEADLDKWEAKMKKLKKQHDNLFYILDVPEGCSTDYIEMKLTEMQEMLPKKFLLVVDYLNIMQSKSSSKNADDHIVQGLIARELKTLARTWNIPVWTATQTKQTKANKPTAVAEDVGRSYGISQNANFVMALVQDKEMELDGVMKLLAAKGRDGKCPDIVLHPNFERMMLDVALLGGSSDKNKDTSKKRK